MNHLKVSVHGEVVCCGERGLPRFDVLRRRRNEAVAFLYAFDLLELDGTTCAESRSIRKATLSSVVRKARGGPRLSEHLSRLAEAQEPRSAC